MIRYQLSIALVPIPNMFTYTINLITGNQPINNMCNAAKSLSAPFAQCVSHRSYRFESRCVSAILFLFYFTFHFVGYYNKFLFFFHSFYSSFLWSLFSSTLKKVLTDRP